MAQFGVSGWVDLDCAPERGSIILSRGLKTTPVHDQEGRHVADVHGHLLRDCLGSSLSSEGDSIRAMVRIDDATQFERHVIAGLVGSYVVEVHSPTFGDRLYVDCGATMPIVYCPETRRFGASAYQILDEEDYLARLNADLVGNVVEGEGDSGWISGTLTAHHGVFRLLANHYLDLRQFTQHRFWPSPDLLSRTPPDLEAAAREGSILLEAACNAIAARPRPAIALTAGLDSRTILAGFRKVRHRVSCFTLATSGPIDIEVPSRICRELDIAHEVLHPAPANEDERARWDRRVGHALRSRNRDVHAAVDQLEADVIVTGLFGEPARAFLYDSDWREIERKPIDASNLLSRLKQPQHPDLLADTEAWLASVAGLPHSTILDLAYLELRMGSWAMGQSAAQVPGRIEMRPFAQWRIQELFLTLSLAERMTNRLLPRMIEHLWPELLAYPINRFGDWRDWLGPLFAAPAKLNPVSIRRYLRKRLAIHQG